jgi:hypothetical protein
MQNSSDDEYVPSADSVRMARQKNPGARKRTPEQEARDKDDDDEDDPFGSSAGDVHDVTDIAGEDDNTTAAAADADATAAADADAAVDAAEAADAAESTQEPRQPTERAGGVEMPPDARDQECLPEHRGNDDDFGPAEEDASIVANSIVASSSKQLSAFNAVASAAANASSVPGTRADASGGDAQNSAHSNEVVNAASFEQTLTEGSRQKKAKRTTAAQQTSAQPDDASDKHVVDFSFYNKIKIAVKGKKAQGLLQFNDFDAFIKTGWTFSRLEFKLPANIDREMAPWAIEMDGHLLIPAVNIPFETFMNAGIRKEVDGIVNDGKQGDYNKLKHCAAATITCHQTTDTGATTVLAFMRVKPSAPSAEAPDDIHVAWSNYRQSMRGDDGNDKYEIVVVLSPATLASLVKSPEHTGMFFSYPVSALNKPSGGRPTTPLHYNKQYSLIEQVQFEPPLSVLTPNKKDSMKIMRQNERSQGRDSRAIKLQKRAQNQQLITNMSGIRAGALGSDEDDEDDDGEEEEDGADEEAGNATRDAMRVRSEQARSIVPLGPTAIVPPPEEHPQEESLEPICGGFFRQLGVSLPFLDGICVNCPREQLSFVEHAGKTYIHILPPPPASRAI